MKLPLKGYKVRPVAAYVNGVWMKRPDVLSVHIGGLHVMTIPKKAYPVPNDRYRTLEGTPQPTFYECEYKLKNWKLLIQRSPVLQEKERKIRDLIREEKLYEQRTR